jgi:tetratricopeptide (TPR) repeat protein
MLTIPEKIDRGDVTDVEALLRQALKYDPGNQSAWWGLGLALVKQGHEEQAVAVWRSGSGIAEELMQRGELARKEGHYQEALQWYKRATRVDPELGDAWYDMGLTYEEMNRGEKAIEMYEQVVDASVFINIGRSSPYYRQGIIYQWQEDPPQLEAALTAYEVAIEIDDFSNDLEAANCHYQRGEILRWTNENPDEYIAEYRQAITLNPDFASAYIYLGVAYYTRYGDATKAEAEIRKAMMLEPGHQWAYYHLGEIYRQEDRVSEAIVMYKHALEVAPDFKIALERLQLLTNPGEHSIIVQ